MDSMNTYPSANLVKGNIDRYSRSATFPSDIEDVSQSSHLITRCIYIVFSHIMTSRRLLPRNNFKKRVIDGTPKGYQAPGFYRSPEDPVLRPNAQKIEIGALQTDYHGASVKVRSVFVNDAYAVGLRAKEGMRLNNLENSLYGSSCKELDASEEAHRSFGNVTIERISKTPLKEVLCDTPPAKRSPVAIHCARNTPKEAPSRKRK